MDETGVLGLLEELSILLEDSKPVFGKGNMRQVDIAAAFEIMDEIRDTFPSEFAQEMCIRDSPSSGRCLGRQIRFGRLDLQRPRKTLG